jgi:hypothetical protein
LLERLSEYMRKENTTMRLSIPPKEMLAVILSKIYYFLLYFFYIISCLSSKQQDGNNLITHEWHISIIMPHNLWIVAGILGLDLYKMQRKRKMQTHVAMV